MKQFILLSLLSLGLFSCEEETPTPSSTPVNPSVTYYSPPSWSTGLWRDSTMTEMGYPNFGVWEFTANDIFVTTTGVQSSFNETFGDPILEEEVGNFYHIKLTGGADYWFERISSTRMYFYQQDPNLPGSYSIYKKY